MIKVSNANYADCNGLYRHKKKLSVDWAPLKPVYKHLTKNRYIFWSTYTKDGSAVGWVIGGKRELSTGSYYHYSKYMLNRNSYQHIIHAYNVRLFNILYLSYLTGGLKTESPWQRTWKKGAVLTCGMCDFST